MRRIPFRLCRSVCTGLSSLLLILRFSPVPLRAQAPGMVTSIENDVFIGTDRWYTNGSRSAFISGNMNWNRLPLWSRPFFSILNQEPGSGVCNFAVSLTGLTFTPEGLRYPELLVNDRPYAGAWIFGLTFFLRERNILNAFRLDLGFVGPSTRMGEIQTWFHKMINSPIPRGWNHQIKDELILNLNAERRWVFHGGDGPFISWQVVPYIAGSLGNMSTEAVLGAQFQTGGCFPANFGAAVMEPWLPLPDPAGNPRPRSGKIHFFVCGGLEAHLVFHDLFLDGNTFRESHHVEKNYVYGQLSIGGGIIAGGRIIQVEAVLQTRRFRMQSGFHSYNGIRLQLPL